MSENMNECDMISDIEDSEQKVLRLEEEEVVKKSVEGRRCSPVNPISMLIDTVEDYYTRFAENNKKVVQIITLGTIWIVFVVYVVAACLIDFERARVLFYLAIISNAILLWNVLKKYLGRRLENILVLLHENVYQRFRNILKWFGVVLFATFVLGWLICDTSKTPSRLISLIGLFVFIFIGYVSSTHRHNIKWRPVIWGFALQFIFGIVILRTKVGFEIFKWMGDMVAKLLGFSSAGSNFVFPGLAQFAFTVLPIIPYFSALTYVLWYLGVIQVLIKKVGWLLQLTLGTSPAESFNAAANIFIGMTEAPLLIRPFLQGMTESELHAVMTGGFATIAGSVLAIYIHLGVSASHLLSASIMSAPAALAMSKLMCPEVEVPAVRRVEDIKVEQPKEGNIFEAVTEGARLSIGLLANIVVNIIAFLSLLKCANSILGWLGSLVDVPHLSFEFISSYVFMPFAYIMGVPREDAFVVAELLGVKSFLNEFIAYKRLSVYITNRENGVPNTTVVSVRGEIIATYALCGFANFGSMGIMIGGIGSLVPSKRSVLAKHVFRSVIAGTLACFMTASVAGLLYDENVYASKNNFINATSLFTNKTTTPSTL